MFESYQDRRNSLTSIGELVTFMPSVSGGITKENTPAIIDDSYQSFRTESGDIGGRVCQATCCSEDVDGAKEGDIIQTRTTTFYIHGQPQPDGTGITLLALHK